MSYVKHLFRHPIKSHGVEEIHSVTLETGKTFPCDRKWAVATHKSKTDGTEWAPCNNFTRGAIHPQLMAVTAKAHEGGNTLTLSHPHQPDFTFQPDDTSQLDGFLEWVCPLMDERRPQPTKIVRVEGRGMTDTDFPSISLLNLNSLKSLSESVETDLSPLRFRGNIWIEDLPPWEEFNMIGKTLTLGDTILKVEERITRCKATTVNPDTGICDINTLKALKEGWGHLDFGIYVTVTQGGTIRLGDELKVSA